MTAMSATERFLTLARGPEADLPLDVACLLIAARARPGEDADDVVAAGRRTLDGLAAETPEASIEAVREHLFTTLGFCGNREHYDDPRNSYLNEVLARRTGIPITLSVVVLEVGRRLGLELAGVGMPGHFLVAVGDGWFLDAFDRGRFLDEEGCRRRFVELAGPGAPWSRELLAPVGPRAIVARVLANLRGLFTESNDLHGLDWVLELRAGIPGVPAREHAERAAVLAALGRFDVAAGELEQLAVIEEAGASTAPLGAARHPSGGPHASGPAFAADLRARAARLRARLN